MGRSPCCEKGHTNKGAWTKEEDHRLVSYIRANGEGCWRSLPKAAGLQRCGKSCRLRWINYLRPDLKRGNFSQEEDEIIVKHHEILGNKWSLIARRLPGRTDNEIKNYWNTHIKRKLLGQGLDPKTHRPLRLIASSHQQAVPVTLETKVLKPEETAAGSGRSSSSCCAAEEEEKRDRRQLNLDLSIGLPVYSSEPETMTGGVGAKSTASTATEEEEEVAAAPGASAFRLSRSFCMCGGVRRRGEACKCLAVVLRTNPPAPFGCCQATPSW